MTTANLITLIRLCLVPMIYWLASTDRGAWAAVIFCLAAGTDAVDGWIARLRGEVSSLGKLLDPLADKALQLTTLFTTARTGFTPVWVVVVLLVKESLLVLGGLWMLHQDYVVSARLYGKVASVLLFVALAGGLLQLDIMQPVLYVGVAVSLLAGLDYLIQAVRTLSNKRTMG